MDIAPADIQSYVIFVLFAKPNYRTKTATLWLSLGKALALTKQETDVNWKNKIWKYTTAFVVVLIILNPEMVEFALFIDAVGLETFLMLLEIQVLAILSAIINTKIKPIFSYVKYLCAHNFLTFSWRNIREKPESLIFMVPSQATLMCMLVFLAAIGVALNVI